MQNAIEALEYNLRSLDMGVKELEEARQHQVKGLDRIRLQITEANRKRAETQQALELLRAVSGFGETKPSGPRKDANIAVGHPDEVAQNAGRTAENYAAHKSAETAHQTFQSPDCNYRVFRGSGSGLDPYRNA